MKTVIDCIACKVRQAIDVVKRATDDPDLQERALKSMLETIVTLSFDRPPVAIRRDAENVVKAILGNPDPYIEHKELSNRIGLAMYPELKKIAADSENPLKTALRLAVAGNIIDFGMFKLEEIDEARVRNLVEETIAHAPAIDDSDQLIADMQRANSILYIADNCGELFFDRVLLEQMPAEKVTLVVRGKPILNDATLEDARYTGLCDLVNVIGDGNDTPALMLEECSPEVLDLFQSADLVISKGQGNYEALSLAPREIYFLLMVKCEVVSSDLSCNVGDIVIKRGGVY